MRKKQTLTVKELINILAETDVKSVKDLRDDDGETLCGLADLDAKLISLTKGMPIAQRRYVVIHELFHMSDYLRGFNTDEETTEERTNRLYERLYGAPYELDK